MTFGRIVPSGYTHCYCFSTLSLLSHRNPILHPRHQEAATHYTVHLDANRKADRRHVWIFFFPFFNDSYGFSAFSALCCPPYAEAATDQLLVFFRSDWCGPGKQSMCHSGIQVPRTLFSLSAYNCKNQSWFPETECNYRTFKWKKNSKQQALQFSQNLRNIMWSV